MDELTRQIFGIDDTMKIVRTGGRNQNRRGDDTDIDYYQVSAADGTLLWKCEVHESISMFPPQRKSTSYKKFDLDGRPIELGVDIGKRGI